jgi:hypothetical protein
MNTVTWPAPVTLVTDMSLDFSKEVLPQKAIPTDLFTQYFPSSCGRVEMHILKKQTSKFPKEN